MLAMVLAAAVQVGIGLASAAALLRGDEPAPAAQAANEQTVTQPQATAAEDAPIASGSDDGLVATAGVLGGDRVEVSEVVSWPDGGPLELRLELPDLSTGSAVEAVFDPVVTGLQVTIDGNPAPAVPLSGSPTVWTVQSPSGTAPTTMTVRYVTEGALVRSTPSQAGRALAVIAPLSHGAIGSLPVRIEIAYEGVLGVGCPRAPVASQVCGRRLEDRWVAEPPPGLPAVVVVQLDLPPPLA